MAIDDLYQTAEVIFRQDLAARVSSFLVAIKFFFLLYAKSCFPKLTLGPGLIGKEQLVCRS